MHANVQYFDQSISFYLTIVILYYIKGGITCEPVTYIGNYFA